MKYPKEINYILSVCGREVFIGNYKEILDNILDPSTNNFEAVVLLDKICTCPKVTAEIRSMRKRLLFL